MKAAALLPSAICAVVLAFSASAARLSAGDSSRPIFDEASIAALEVLPREASLRGRDCPQQLVVTARLKSGQSRDVTRIVRFESLAPVVAAVDRSGVVRPVGSGQTEIAARLGGKLVRTTIKVELGERFLPVDFRREIIPILTKGGCNGGACHGKSGGRGGFQLSLFGFDPRSDYESITKSSRGRRISPAAPDTSLLLVKPLALSPHGGGKRLEKDQPEFQRLRRWIASGAPWGEAAETALERIEVEPAVRLLSQDDDQQLLVTAVYRDGSRHDVTRTTEFRSNETSIALVDEHGLLAMQGRYGETSVVCIYGGQVGVSRIVIPRSESSAWPAFPVANLIDRHVSDKLHELRLPPSPLADDATFLRRACLQIAGRVPAPQEVKDFLASTDPQKRVALVDSLLASGGYADHFAQKWSDILRNKRRNQNERMPYTLGFHRWLRNALVENMPYDRFVRQIVAASGTADVHPPAQWYAEVRYLDRYVDDTAQVFLGVRIGCARCHNHPFEKFTQQDYYGLAAFFSRVGRKGGSGVEERRVGEAIFVKAAGEVKHPVTNEIVAPHGLGGPNLDIAPYDNPRNHLVDWMTKADNPYFARAFVNRMWAHFFSRGLVEPLDDLRVTNPASNEPLLNDLAREFVESGFGMRHIVRLIATSTTYQLGSTANKENLDDVQAHARFYPQRLNAEVLLDAIDSVTETATSFGGLPAGTKAVQLPDEGYSNAFLTLFGRPPRESPCECEREAKPNLSQSLFLMNDQFFLGKVMSGSGYAQKLAKEKRSEREKIDELFIAALARLPRAEEIERALQYIKQEPNIQTAYRNLLWALLNTKEFLYVH